MYFKNIFLLFFIFLFIISCDNKTTPEELRNTELNLPSTDDDKISYALGHEMGQKARTDSIKINMDYYTKGYFDGKDSSYKTIPFDSIQSYLNKFNDKYLARMEAQMKQRQETQKVEQEKMMKTLEDLAKTAKADGIKFLAENKNKPGIITTASGLQYKVIKEGSGELLKDNDIVKIHMSIKAVNGPELQNTRGKDPLIIQLKDLFPGWKEGMNLMKKGSHFEMFIPSKIAFDDKGYTPAIPPHSAVVMDVEVLDMSNQEQLTAFRNKMLQLQQQMMMQQQQQQQLQQQQLQQELQRNPK